MKRLLFLMLSTFCVASFAQIPDNVPTEGLVGWWPLNGDLEDVTGNYPGGQSFGAEFVPDRNGVPHGAISFDGDGSYAVIDGMVDVEDFSISLWYFADQEQTSVQTDVFPLIYVGRDSGIHPNVDGFGTGFSPDEMLSFFGGRVSPQGGAPAVPSVFQEWIHWTVTYSFSAQTMTSYRNGIEAATATFSNYWEPNPTIFFGAVDSIAYSKFHGILDDVSIWNRVLNDEEVMSLSTAYIVPGCTDEDACNFNALASLDDGSCVFTPVIDLGEDIETCEDSVVLDAGEGFNFYEWSTGEITQTIVVTETGEYAVSASNVIENNHALQFNGTDATGAPAEPILFGTESFSVSVDCKLNAFKGNDSEPYSYIIGHPLTQGTGDHGFKIQTAGTSLNGGFQVHINDEGTTHFNVISFDNGMETNVELDQWYDLTMVVDRNNAQFSFYVDGTLIETQTIHPDFGNVDHPNGMSLGVQSIHGSSLLNGDLDNLQIWDVALSAEEVAHWQTTVPSGSETGLVGYWNFEEGEGDEAYDVSHLAPTIALNNVGWSDNTPSAVFDASCAASDTIQVSWLIRGCTDPEACNYVEDASCDDGTCASCEALQTACGPGTIWDAEMQMCIGDGSGDINLDGCVQLNDLLDLLSAYGNCASEESAWQCGETLEYQGYDYATVQIGEQCWFAENLRAENYRNGDEILSDVIGSQWQYLTEGACAVYGESDGCEAADFYSACDPIESLNAFGRLYNWYAVNNIHGICPSTWHVPTDVEWDVLDDAMGGGNLTDEALKATFGWNSDNGTNASGFSAIPSGKRDVPGGDFIAAGDTGGWWSSTENGAYAWTRLLNTTASELVRYGPNKKDGFSIRCIKNAE